MIDYSKLPESVLKAVPMTAGELLKKLRRVPSEARVFILLDKQSEFAWDDDNSRWRYVIPLGRVRKDTCDELGESDSDRIIFEGEY